MSLKAIILIASLSILPQCLHAATANDMIGSWQVDTDATWDQLKKMPVVTSLSADDVKQVKAALIEQMKSAVFVFTANKLTSHVGGETKEETYVVTKSDHDSVFTDDTAADGKITHSRVDISPDQLIITNTDSPSEIVVLKRQIAVSTPDAGTTPTPAPASSPAPAPAPSP